MKLFNSTLGWLALGLGIASCAAEGMATPTATPVQGSAVPSGASAQQAQATTPSSSSSSNPTAVAVPVQPAAAAGSAAPVVTAPPAPAAAPAAPPAAPPAAAPVPPAAPPPAAPAPGAPGAAPKPETSTPVPAAPGAGGGKGADAFCDKYGMHCGYAKPNRHASREACIADFNATPAQQGCKNMHMDTSIAGTAAACNGMPSEFCFSIHCLHTAGIVDPTGITYCK